jgi:hypothetical protein
MRLSDLDKHFFRNKEIKKNKELGSREVDLTTEQVVLEMKKENSLAKEKIEKIPSQTREELTPFFNPTFWKKTAEV